MNEYWHHEDVEAAIGYRANHVWRQYHETHNQVPNGRYGGFLDWQRDSDGGDGGGTIRLRRSMEVSEERLVVHSERLSIEFRDSQNNSEAGFSIAPGGEMRNIFGVPLASKEQQCELLLVLHDEPRLGKLLSEQISVSIERLQQLGSAGLS